MMVIATEEISHMEMAAEGFALANARAKVVPMMNSNAVKSRVLGGHGPLLGDSAGVPFSGSVDADNFRQ